MDRKPGSFVADKGGKERPNENDEAMAARHGLRPGKAAARGEVKDVPEK